MNTMPDSYAPPAMRASDADRDGVLAELSSGFEAGRLTPGEFDERTSQALAARTMGELAALTSDLPGGQPPGMFPPGTDQPGTTLSGIPAGQHAAMPGRLRRGGRGPLAVVAAVVILAVIVSSVTTAHASWHAWWIVLPVLVLARLARRRSRPGLFRRG